MLIFSKIENVLITFFFCAVSLIGSVKSFYSRVPFKKMVSYSVRSRVSVSRKSITEG